MSRTVLLAALLLPAVALAQSVPPSAGTVQESLKRPRAVVPVEPGPAVETPAPSRPPLPEGGKRVRVNRFVIHGNESIPIEELAALVEEWEGRDLTLEEIYGVSDVLTGYYHKRGFPLAIVTVPAQKVSGGVIRLAVVEGRVDALRFQGNEGYGDDFLAARLARIAPGTVLRLADLERCLLLLDDLPGLTARSVVQPGAKYGTSDIVFSMEEKRWEGSVSLDNHGTRAVGEWRFGTALRWNNPGGRGDALDIGYTRTEQGLLDNVSLGYDLPVGRDGARLGASYSYADYQVGWLFQPLGIAGNTSTGRLDYSYPWVRSRERNVVLGLALSHQEAESTALGTPVSDTRLTLLEASVDASFIYKEGMVSTLSATLGGNFRRNPDGQANNRQRLRLVVDASHERRLAERLSLYLRGQLVWSPDPLVDTQKFSLGGPDSVRGYLLAAERGDRGGLFTAELRRRMTLGEGLDATLRLFADYGAVRRLAPAPGEAADAHLSAVGVGLLVARNDNYAVDLQWAKPTAGRPSGGEADASRLWASFSATF
ncbi:ShlB/FhaC/HecB family hemolysin secretion/activation protein [Endothiovibrio diazotrophicus]